MFFIGLFFLIIMFLSIKDFFEKNNQNQLEKSTFLNESDQIKQTIALIKPEMLKNNEKNEKVVGADPEFVKKYGADVFEISKKLEQQDYSPIDGKRIAFLTFDDGPSKYTEDILKILKQRDVPATFFLVGNQITEYEDKVQKIYENGSALGNHTCSHNFSKLFKNKSPNLEVFKKEIVDTNNLIKKALKNDNFTTNVFRMPGGSKSWRNTSDVFDYLKEIKMASIDWNALNSDAEGRYKNSNELFERFKASVGDKEMVVSLMHEKPSTLESLPKVLDFLLEKGFTFKILI
ncbi:MAG: polysaccharide deacetylase family protein [Oscillospiraceae bacterium]|nr:polysaccharide deacetylase family protein [Oscillospiraceae bacterium]